MQQKYAYAYNGVYNWVRGIFALPQKNARIVHPYTQPSTTYVWRNQFTDAYKMGDAYTQQPMDLSNFVFIRTRERLLLENKVNAPQRVLKSGKISKLTKHSTEQSLSHVEKDLSESLSQL